MGDFVRASYKGDSFAHSIKVDDTSWDTFSLAELVTAEVMRCYCNFLCWRASLSTTWVAGPFVTRPILRDLTALLNLHAAVEFW